MKNSLMAALVIICFLLLAGRSSSARLLANGLFISPANPSGFDPNLNSVADGHVEKDAVECDQENSASSSSSASSSKNSIDEINKLSLRLSPTIQNLKKADQLDEGVMKLLPTGVPSIKVNSMQMTEQRLSKSKHSRGVVHMQMTERRLSKSTRSPGVGHMQMTRHKSQTVNVDSHHSNGDDKSEKRKMGSIPSVGVGH